jgi:hypothetical protein
MASESKITTDREEIEKWAKARQGQPAKIQGVGRNGILRIYFPGYSGKERLEEISWDEFFEEFESGNLALIYQETTEEGELSRFNRLVDRDSIPEIGPADKTYVVDVVKVDEDDDE